MSLPERDAEAIAQAFHPDVATVGARRRTRGVDFQDAVCLLREGGVWRITGAAVVATPR